jgi:hypothetical protein
MSKHEMYGIDTFVKEVLIHRFPHETYKHTPKSTAKGIRFHCPYCGDTCDIRKTPRGNLYMSSKKFVCFNDGCFTSTSLERFVLKFSELYSIDIGDIDLTEIKLEETSNKYFNNLILTKDNTIYDYLDDMGLIDKMPHIDEFKYIFSLVDIRDISKTSKVYEFLDKRCLLSIHNIHTRVYSDIFDSRVFILNIDDFTNRILSYASRSISHKIYTIQIYSDILKVWNPPNGIDIEHVNFLDMISSYYNIMNVDFTKDVNVTEGQFDAMFLDNHMALQGVSKISFILNHIQSDKINIILDNDKGGYKSTMKYMDLFGVFMWNKLISDFKYKFSSDVKHLTFKIKDVNDLFIFLYKKNKNLTLSEFNNIINEYITKNIYDRLFI